MKSNKYTQSFTEHQENLNISDVIQLSIFWWNKLGGNPLLRLIKQGELTTKYYGQQRISKSLTDREIENIYVSENVN